MARHLIDQSARIFESRIAPDVFIGEFCTVRRCVIGGGTKLLERVSLKRVKVGCDCLINSGTYIENAKIGDGAMIAPNCTIVGVTHKFSRESGVDHENVWELVTIGDCAWIGAGSIILPGVTIGRCAVVGAGATVREDVPDRHVYVGTPLDFKRYPIEE